MGGPDPVKTGGPAAHTDASTPATGLLGETAPPQALDGYCDDSVPGFWNLPAPELRKEDASPLASRSSCLLPIR